MVTDGVDYYNLRYDPDDPYVQAAIADAVRARIVIYSIYWRNQGRFDRTMYANDSGQNLMLEVTQATGGHSYWEGFGNPVSFQPFLEDLTRRLQNQYEISFAAPIDRNKPGGAADEAEGHRRLDKDRRTAAGLCRASDPGRGIIAANPYVVPKRAWVPLGAFLFLQPLYFLQPSIDIRSAPILKPKAPHRTSLQSSAPSCIPVHRPG